MTLLNAVVQGLFLGSLYALLATGLSLIFGVMRIINLAQGDLAILGAYLTWQVCTSFGVSPFLAILIVIPIMFAVGYLLQRSVLARSLRGGELTPLLTTFGISIVLQNLFLQVYSPDSRGLGAYAGAVATGSWTITSQLSIPFLGVVVLLVALVVLGGLQWMLSSTAFGREMRATAQDPDTAGLVGIPAASIYARATAIAVASAGLAGAFLAMRTTFSPISGPTQLIFAFEAVVIGGLGSLWGTLWGGIVLGISQTVGAELLGPAWFVLTGHLVFLVVLVTPRFRQLLTRRRRVVPREAMA
ncbi:MAG TPA: branched-chain amino acid ABC transporter permease [Propionibacteriaceae bacterium]|nr:branched-chain amino acid ABC transporter permease [Propionibacteriaceae bacterium]